MVMPLPDPPPKPSPDRKRELDLPLLKELCQQKIIKEAFVCSKWVCKIHCRVELRILSFSKLLHCLTSLLNFFLKLGFCLRVRSSFKRLLIEVFSWRLSSYSYYYSLQLFLIVTILVYLLSTIATIGVVGLNLSINK